MVDVTVGAEEGIMEEVHIYPMVIAAVEATEETGVENINRLEK